MKKLRKNQFGKKDRLKVFIRLDRHLQRLKLAGFFKDVLRDFPNFPEKGFKSWADFEKWREENLWGDEEASERWQKVLSKGLKHAKLPETYLHVVENFIALNIQGDADVSLPGIPHHRTDRNYLRAKRLMEIYDSINPKTGKKYTSEEVADEYTPPEKWPLKKIDRWIDKYGVVDGDAVRKIISKYKIRLLR